MASSKELKEFDKNQEKKERRKDEKLILDDTKLIRILSKDIPGNKKVYVGLTLIKGISWSFSNAICNKIGIDKNKQIQDLSKEEITKLSEFIKNPGLPIFLLNRRNDYDSGTDKHLHGSDLELQKEFDIKRLKKIKSYRGIRHSTGQPVRGQRTKSHFRANRKKTGAVGVKKKPGAKR